MSQFINNSASTEANTEASTDTNHITSINYITNIYYINLASRPDRKEYIEQELSRVGFSNFKRFNAVKLPNGAIGCSLSHIKILEEAKRQNLDHVMIVEDDIQFLNPKLFVQQFNSFLSNTKDFDVLLIAGNNIPPYERTADYCIKVTRCQTTTGYLVKRHYYDTLIQNYREGLQKLLVEPNNHIIYAIDKYWFNLQGKDTWYLITPLTVTQRQDYSDIEQRLTNYARAMLDLDKVNFFKRQTNADSAVRPEMVFSSNK